EAFRDEAVDRLAHGFGGRAAKHLLRRRVEKDDALVFIHGDDRVHRCGDNARQPLLAFAQRLLGLFLVINVRIGTEPLDDLAVRISQRPGSRLEPTVHAVIAADAVLDIETLAGRHSLLPGCNQWLTVVGVNLPQPVKAELLGFRDAGVSDILRADVVTSSVGPASPDELRQGFGQLPEAALTFAQRLLS